MRLKKAALVAYALTTLCSIGAVICAALDGNMHQVGVYSFTAGAWLVMTVLTACELKNK